MPRLCSLLVLIVAFSFLLQGCATVYEDTATSAWDQMASGEIDEALNDYEENVTSKNDYLLKLMDQAILLRVAGRYEESNEKFFEAAEIIELAGYNTVTDEVSTILTNERQKVYQGEDFEKVLIHAYLALNFIALRDWQAALVETRKVNEILYIMINEGQKPYKLDAFARYLGGLIYDSQGETNDAYIAYNKTYEIDPTLRQRFPVIEFDLIRTAKLMGFSQELKAFKQEFGQDRAEQILSEFQKKNAQMVLVFESGLSPRKYSTKERHYGSGKGGSTVEALVPVAHYQRRKSDIVAAEIELFPVGEGQAIAKSVSASLSDIAQTAKEHLQDRMGKHIRKALLQASVKAGIATGVGVATDSEELGLLAGLALFALSDADTRSWLLLPERLQVAKIYVEPGVYDIKIHYRDRSSEAENFEWLRGIELKARDVKILQRRAFE